MRTRISALALLAAGGVAAGLVIAPGGAGSAATLYGSVSRVSRSSTGGLPDTGASTPTGQVLSSDGRYAVYYSTADDIGPSTSGAGEFYRYDARSGKTILVSAAPDGTPADNGALDVGAISGNGRYVVYAAYAGNTNTLPTRAPDFCTAEGNPPCWLLLRADTATGRTTTVTEAGGTAILGDPRNVSTSADGRYVVYATRAAMLAGDTNGVSDVYRYDTRTGTNVLVSHAAAGGKANQSSDLGQVSADGNLVSFESGASDIAPTGLLRFVQEVYLADLATGTTVLVSHDASGKGLASAAGDPAISGDGSAVAYTGEGQGLDLYDVAKDTTQKVSRFYDSLGPDTEAYQPSLSSDGRFVAYHLVRFGSLANSMSDYLIRYDVARNTSVIIRQYDGDQNADLRSLSADARHLAFEVSNETGTPPGQVYEWTAP